MTGPGWDAVFLDRDGTINTSPGPGRYVLSPDAVTLLPGAGQAIGRLTAAGAAVFVVTNQRAVHLGLLSPVMLEAVHDRLLAAVHAFGGTVDGFLVCPHDVSSCGCRKPGDELLRRVFDSRPWLRPSRCAIVGDSRSDVRAGDELGLVRVLLAGPEVTAAGARVELVARDLAEAVDRLLAPTKPVRMSP